MTEEAAGHRGWGSRESGALGQAPAVPSRCEDRGPHSPVSTLRAQKGPWSSQLQISRISKGKPRLITIPTVVPEGDASQCPRVPCPYRTPTEK